MLRLKKYNLLKNKGLNYVIHHLDPNITNLEFSYLRSLFEIYISNQIIKITPDYHIIKDNILQFYIIKFTNIVLFHISQNHLENFISLYNSSTSYSFDIYTTTYFHNNNYVEMYYAFCISHEIPDYDYKSFNDSNKYLPLSILYGPCLLINNRFDTLDTTIKYNNKYKFLITLGHGNINNTSRSFIKSTINTINKQYQTTLPPHYIK